MEFDLLNFTKNAVERLLSFGQLPENVPEINMEGYSYNTVEAFLDISISSNKSSILISKIISVDYAPLRKPIKINKKILENNIIDIRIPYSKSLETINSICIKVYFQDIQNRRYVAKILISLRCNSWLILQVRRAFCK